MSKSQEKNGIVDPAEHGFKVFAKTEGGGGLPSLSFSLWLNCSFLDTVYIVVGFKQSPKVKHTESEGILIYLDLIQPERRLRQHLSSGFNELDLWITTMYTIVKYKFDSLLFSNNLHTPHV